MKHLRLRDYTPRALYARLAALVAIPVLAIFAITTIYYYREHISDVNRKLSQSVAREVGLIMDLCADPAGSGQDINTFSNQLGVIYDCQHDAGFTWPAAAKARFGYDDVLRRQIADASARTIEVRTIDSGSVLDFRSEINGAVTRILVDRKRALAANTHFTIVWVLLGTLFMLGLAFGFLRNQVRSILQLTEAAKAFGLGRNLPDFRPSGPTEIRDAARAIIEMRSRLTSFTEQRMAMLAAVSHDLRTPLTRLKLQLAMMDNSEEIDGARNDLDDMAKMLDEYLAFAKGEEGETPEEIRLDHVAHLVAERIPKARLTDAPKINITVRPLALSRTLDNLLGNAAQYGDVCELRLVKGPRRAEIIVDDDGPGIPTDQREDAFKPFHRLNSARSQNLPGTGLGLTLARDFARAHGGDIRLEDSPLGGLRVRMRLPY